MNPAVNRRAICALTARIFACDRRGARAVAALLASAWRTKSQENHILWNPASELELPPQPKHLPRALLSVEDIEQILRAVDHATTTGLRDRAMLEVLYSTGLRRSGYKRNPRLSIQSQRVRL